MTDGWQYVLNETSVEFLVGCRQWDRAQLLIALENLAGDPAQEGDWIAKDDTGRPIQLKQSGRFIISFWADHFVKELRIIKIERV